MQLLVQLSGKLLCVIWNVVTKSYTKFVTLISLSEKLIYLLEVKKNTLPDYLWDDYFFLQFVNNFSTLLLCKINFLDIVGIGDFLQIFIISRSSEIRMVLNFKLRVYTWSILNIIITRYLIS